MTFKLSKRLTAMAMATMMTLSLPVISFAKETDIQPPTYQSDWGMNLPQKIADSSGVTTTDNVFSIDVVKTDKSTKGQKYVFAYMMDLMMLMAQIDHPGKTDYNNDINKLGAAAKEAVNKYVDGFYDRDGKRLNVILDYMPDLEQGYVDNAAPGDVLFTIVLKNTHPIAAGVKLHRDTFWEKVNSNVYGPGETTTLEKDLHYGVTTTDSYTFAKTVGTSQGIKIGGQLGGDYKGGKGGLSSEYSYTMTNSVTNTIAHSRTIVNDETSKILVQEKNDKDHAIAYGLYRAVDQYNQFLDSAAIGASNQFASIQKNGCSTGYYELRIGTSYTYRYSDYATVKSN